MPVASIKTRFVFSIFSNGLRALLSLVTGLAIARGLSPTGFGDLAYLLGSFLAIRALLDLGSSNAFYTFISRRPRGRSFFFFYFKWLLIQLGVSVLLVGALLPQSLFDRTWLGQPRGLVLLALLASFLQQQVWTTISQIGEAARLTIRVQSLGLVIVAAHLVVVIVLREIDVLSVRAVLIAIVCEYLGALAIAPKLLARGLWSQSEEGALGAAGMLDDYWRFCRPLIALAATAFLYEFADRWLLQRYGGAEQQGYYQIAAQLATAALLATTSILSIFWKEVAEASARQDHARLAVLYGKVTRGLLALSATLSCFLIPWAREIVDLLLGAEYAASWPILALMLIYPIHQSVGQVNAAVFMGSERTGVYTAIAVVGQAVSIPLSILLLAKPGDWLPGLALGAYGLAIKMVTVNILFANVQSLLISKFTPWRFEFAYQFIVIGALLAIAYVARTVGASIYSDVESVRSFRFAVALGVSALLYAAVVAGLLWRFPQAAGLEREEIRSLALRLKRSLVPS